MNSPTQAEKDIGFKFQSNHSKTKSDPHPELILKRSYEMLKLVQFEEIA